MAEVKEPAKPIHSRRARAEGTRLRVIRTAHKYFVERGYSGTRVADVAVASGVAVQTVYFRFHTKAELLQACYEVAVLGEETPLPPERQRWYQSFLEADSGPAALRHFAEGNTTIVVRVGALDDVVRSALHEPDAAAVRARSEQLRRDGYRVLCERLASRFGLRRSLDLAAATDLLLTFGGTSLYRSLVLEYGWPLPRYVDWLESTLAAQLLAGDS